MSIVPTGNLSGARTGSRVVSFVAGALGMALVITLANRGVFHHDGPNGPAAVVQRIQRLERLESVRYTLEKVVTAERQNRYLPPSLGGERILLVVRGEVVAGVDLSKLQASAVQVKGTQVTIHLPAAEILSSRLDNQATRVFSRETGLLVPADPNFESEVRADAERQIRQAALDDGILDNAAANARSTVVALVRGLGFQEVEVK